MNDLVRIPYIRMDASFRDFISVANINWSRVPEKLSLCLHNPSSVREYERLNIINRRKMLKMKVLRSIKNSWFM